MTQKSRLGATLPQTNTQTHIHVKLITPSFSSWVKSTLTSISNSGDGEQTAAGRLVRARRVHQRLRTSVAPRHGRRARHHVGSQGDPRVDQSQGGRVHADRVGAAVVLGMGLWV